MSKQDKDLPLPYYSQINLNQQYDFGTSGSRRSNKDTVSLAL